MFKTIILLAIVVVGASALQDEKPEAAPEPYSYQYETDSHSASESKDANGKVTGFYTLADADGRQRRVDYEADAAGFRAKVQTNEVGTKSENSADVEVLASPPTREQLVQVAQSAAQVQQQQQVQQQYASQFAVQPQVQRVVTQQVTQVPQRSAVYGSYQSSSAVPSSQYANSAAYGSYESSSAAPSSQYANSAAYGNYQSSSAVPSSQYVNSATYGYYPYQSGSYGAYALNNANQGYYGYSAGYPVADAANYKVVTYNTQQAVPAAQYTVNTVRNVAVPVATTATNYRTISGYQTVPVGSIQTVPVSSVQTVPVSGYQSVGNYNAGQLVGQRQTTTSYQYVQPATTGYYSSVSNVQQQPSKATSSLVYN